MSDSNRNREPSPPGKPVIARRRTRRPILGHGDDHDIPVLFRIPDLTLLQPDTQASDSAATKSSADTKMASDEAIAPAARVALRVDQGQLTPSPHGNFLPANSSVIHDAVHEDDAALGTGLVASTVLSHVVDAGSVSISEPSALPRQTVKSREPRSDRPHRSDTNASDMGTRDRRRRRDEELTDEAQAMRKQWATVLVLVAVISASFYLLNRPRHGGDTTRDPHESVGTPGDMARKQQTTRPRSLDGRSPGARSLNSTLRDPATDDENASMVEEYDYGDRPIDDPAVPDTLIPEPSNLDVNEAADGRGDSAMLNRPNADAPGFPEGGYPTTDPSRYEYGRDPYVTTERASATRTR